MPNLIIVGAGALARELVPLVTQDGHTVVGLECELTPPGTLVAGIPVLGPPMGDTPVMPTTVRMLAVADPALRRRLYRPENLYIGYHGLGWALGPHTINKGTLVWPNVTLGFKAQIGRFNIFNTGAFIGHDTVSGDWVTVNPCVTVCGFCVIGNECNLGAGAVIGPRVVLPARGTIGAGSVVIKSPVLPEGYQAYTMAGNPARLLEVT